MQCLLEFHVSNTKLTQELVNLLDLDILLILINSFKIEEAILSIWMQILKENDFWGYLIQLLENFEVCLENLGM